ncbi:MULTISPECIES: glycosyltransferase family A protein [Bradyrhizobium]|uniref:Glycosyltransferase involved in cell wall biosynthesis n=1 Tax=Bradyrhizobium yuanmingense TaxID=108015 RepID=A0ABV4GP25_9BRAD|nr:MULTISPECIES: glycosyltransferase family A protein [Bradyrhizobium]MCA1529355.1 glycosyltransferase family 2 protein [Bradyrhizobium yuanmingense]MCA1550164.1 glycosyltransferase family 2 protein [Bradyrhizobium sp. BRP19]
MAGSNKTIQVYIPVYNDIRFLPDAVASVLMQQDVEVEVIVSDNASTDGTSEWLANAASMEPRLSVHRNRENQGMMNNINRIGELVTADYYMFLCSDDRLGATDALSSALKVMTDTPDVVSVYCDLLYIDALGRTLAARRFNRVGRFDTAATLKASIISGRNLFGIPLLHRRSAGAAITYPGHLSYLADVYHSAKCAEHGSLFHLPRQLIHNRYSGGNATGKLYHLSLLQFNALADEFGIKLSWAERALQRLQTHKTVLSKAAFMRYAGWRSRRA